MWDRNFYDNRLGAGFIEQLLTPGKLANGQTLTYAYGLQIDEYKGIKQIAHGGAFAGFRCEMVRFPEKRLTVICLANLANIEPDEFALRVADLFLAGSLSTQPEAPKPTVITIARDALAAFAGSYRDPRDGALCTFIVDHDALALERAGGLRIALLPFDQTRFRDKDGRRNIVCDFLLQQDARPRQVRVQIADGPARAFDAIKVASPTPKELEDYVGTYYSPEVEATLTFVIDNGWLQVDPPRRPRQALRVGMHDEFIGSPGTVQFERDASSRVTGFRYNLRRARKVRFDRQSDGH